MQYEKIKRLIADNEHIVEFAPFGDGVSDEWVEKAEVRLGVKFPLSYRWWLKNYGGGEIHGEEIFSVYEMDFDVVVGGDIVYINELNRKNGVLGNHHLVIQENDQGESYYFDLNQSIGGECPIYVDVSYEISYRCIYSHGSKKVQSNLQRWG